MRAGGGLHALRLLLGGRSAVGVFRRKQRSRFTVRSMVVAEWYERREELADAEKLEALLDRVASDARSADMPQAVDVTVEGAGTLGIVVGAERSFLHHVPPDRYPPYMVSVGRDGGEQPFVFCVAGDHYTETSWRNTIEPEAARAAIRHFVSTGTLSPDVEWEEV